MGLFTVGAALTLGVALYALTRQEDREFAMLALMCRVCEGVLGSLPTPLSLGLLGLAAGVPAGMAPSQSTLAASELLLTLKALLPLLGATFFAAGSLIFSYLFARGRTVPRGLAMLGIVAFALLLVLVPAQLAGMPGSADELHVGADGSLRSCPGGVVAHEGCIRASLC